MYVHVEKTKFKLHGEETIEKPKADNQRNHAYSFMYERPMSHLGSSDALNGIFNAQRA